MYFPISQVGIAFPRQNTQPASISRYVSTVVFFLMKTATEIPGIVLISH